MWDPVGMPTALLFVIPVGVLGGLYDGMSSFLTLTGSLVVLFFSWLSSLLPNLVRN